MTLSEARDSISTLSVLDHEIVTGSIDGKVRNYDIRKGMLSEDVIGRKLNDAVLRQKWCLQPNRSSHFRHDYEAKRFLSSQQPRF